MKGVELPVDVGKRNCVVVHNVNGTHSGADQRFYNIAANASYAKNGDVCCKNFFHSCGAVSKLCTRKLSEHVVIVAEQDKSNKIKKQVKSKELKQRCFLCP